MTGFASSHLSLALGQQKGQRLWPNDHTRGKQNMLIWPGGEGGWQCVLLWGGFPPVPRETQGVRPTSQMEATAKDLCHVTRVPFGSDPVYTQARAAQPITATPATVL